jgi:threonine aldolase
MNFIDLRSDTVTEPTDEMRAAMFEAQVGDDVYRDDPTMIELENYAAYLTGKEAALFVPSGTFGNQLALFTHCRRGSEVILGDDCHIVQHEVGAASVIAGVQLRTLSSNRGELDPNEIESKIRTEDIHYPATSLICLENAHSNGRVISLENMARVHNISIKNKIPIHLDGARLFNAASYLNVDAQDICCYCDSVMFCLSKGLCAPVGSILAGDKSFIDRARKGRKLMGGGLRQSGFLAAAGLIALQTVRLRLGEDHQNARLMGEELAKIPGLDVNLENIHINMVYFTLPAEIVNGDQLVGELQQKGIKINPSENGLMRFVCHNWVKEKDVHYVADTLKELLARMA